MSPATSPQEISRRFAVPVRAHFQAGRAGLSQGAAQRLPQSISLGTVSSEDRPAAFIHAKVLAFQRPHGMVLAIGSANCSRAALLAESGRGNAELMAVDVLTTTDADNFFGDLILSDAAPTLPQHPPSDDWEIDATPPFRILAARRDAERLEIAFKSDGPISDLALLAPEGRWTAVQTHSGVASFVVPVRITKAQITARKPLRRRGRGL